MVADGSFTGNKWEWNLAIPAATGISPAIDGDLAGDAGSAGLTDWGWGSFVIRYGQKTWGRVAM